MCVKQRCYEETFGNAKKGICEKVGHDVASIIKEEYRQSTDSEKDGMMKVLLRKKNLR